MNSHFVVRSLIPLAAALASGAASAAFVHLNGNLSGLAESPSNTSPGIGSVVVDLDTSAHTLHVQSTFSGLVPLTSTGLPSGTTNAHIHCCTAVPFTGTVGVATTTPSFAGFPLGVTAGSFDQTYNLSLASSWNPAFITANGGTPLSAEAVFAAGLLAGRTYFNIHTNAFSGGEIRGFLIPTEQAVPEPATLGLLAFALGAAAVSMRRQHASMGR